MGYGKGYPRKSVKKAKKPAMKKKKATKKKKLTVIKRDGAY